MVHKNWISSNLSEHKSKRFNWKIVSICPTNSKLWKYCWNIKLPTKYWGLITILQCLFKGKFCFVIQSFSNSNQCFSILRTKLNKRKQMNVANKINGCKCWRSYIRHYPSKRTSDHSHSIRHSHFHTFVLTCNEIWLL